MMTMLLLYAYCIGILSSPKIERALLRCSGLRVLTGNQQPDHSRIIEFSGSPGFTDRSTRVTP